MIRVIEQTDSMIEQEAISLFNQIKPLLDEGHSYCSALETIESGLTRNSIYKRVKEYGDTQGYSPKIYSVCAHHLQRGHNHSKNKWGLLNVSIQTRHSGTTSHHWKYRYFEKEAIKQITRNDLKELRRVVEDRGLEWKVIDLEKAKKAYEFNEIIQTKKRDSKIRNKTGVKRVSKRKCSECNQGYTWKYEDSTGAKRVYISSVDPQKLKQEVLEKGLEWIILDEEKAKENGFL